MQFNENHTKHCLMRRDAAKCEWGKGLDKNVRSCYCVCVQEEEWKYVTKLKYN